MVKMETRNLVQGNFGTGSDFRRSVIIVELWQPEVARCRKILRNFCFFGKTTPYRKLQKSVPKFFITTPIDVLCSNFVKFG